MEAKAIPPLSQDEIVSRLDELPTLPNIVYELSRVINDPMSSTEDVERIMNGDPSLTFKILMLVNSAYYAIPGGVSNLGRAIAYIGFDTINQLVLSATVVDSLAMKGPQRFDLNEFWKHSVGTGIATETIARFIHHPTPADMFTCGLLHDIGKIAMYRLDPDTVLHIVKTANYKAISYGDAERELGAVQHTKVGMLLAQKWNLPSTIQATIAYHHHRDTEPRGKLSHDIHRAIDLVFLGNLFTHAFRFGNSGHNKTLGAPTDILERIGLQPERDLKPLLAEIKTSLDKGADFLRVLGGGKT